MGKGSLRARKLSELKEPNKGLCGWSPENKAQKCAGAGSCTHRTSTLLTILLALWIVWERQKEAPRPQTAEPDTGLWGPSVLPFPFQEVTCSFGKQQPLDLRAVFSCCSSTFGGCRNEPVLALPLLRHILSSLPTFPV